MVMMMLQETRISVASKRGEGMKYRIKGGAIVGILGFKGVNEGGEAS